MKSATFKPELLRTVRESQGLTQSQLAADARVTQTLLSKYESGAAIPSDESLEKLSSSLKYPLDFFYGAAPTCIAGLTHHRKRSSLSAKVRARLEAEARLRILDLEKALKGRDFKSNLPIFDGASPDDAARKLRKHWKLSPAAPVDNLVELLEKNGVVVLQFDFQTEKIDGFFISVNADVACVALNAKGFPPDRRRFTLSHELGHAVLHRDRFPDDEVEAEANGFASEFLAPQKGIQKDFPAALTLGALAALKRKWKISMAAALRRAFDLGAINEKQYRQECIRLSAAGYRKHEPSMGVAPENATLARRLLAECAENSNDPLWKILGLSEEIFQRRYPEFAGETL